MTLFNATQYAKEYWAPLQNLIPQVIEAYDAKRSWWQKNRVYRWFTESKELRLFRERLKKRQKFSLDGETVLFKIFEEFKKPRFFLYLQEQWALTQETGTKRAVTSQFPQAAPASKQQESYRTQLLDAIAPLVRLEGSKSVSARKDEGFLICMSHLVPKLKLLFPVLQAREITAIEQDFGVFFNSFETFNQMQSLFKEWCKKSQRYEAFFKKVSFPKEYQPFIHRFLTFVKWIADINTIIQKERFEEEDIEKVETIVQEAMRSPRKALIDSVANYVEKMKMRRDRAYDQGLQARLLQQCAKGNNPAKEKAIAKLFYQDYFRKLNQDAHHFMQMMQTLEKTESNSVSHQAFYDDNVYPLLLKIEQAKQPTDAWKELMAKVEKYIATLKNTPKLDQTQIHEQADQLPDKVAFRPHTHLPIQENEEGLIKAIRADRGDKHFGYYLDGLMKTSSGDKPLPHIRKGPKGAYTVGMVLTEKKGHFKWQVMERASKQPMYAESIKKSNEPGHGHYNKPNSMTYFKLGKHAPNAFNLKAQAGEDYPNTGLIFYKDDVLVNRILENTSHLPTYERPFEHNKKQWAEIFLEDNRSSFFSSLDDISTSKAKFNEVLGRVRVKSIRAVGIFEDTLAARLLAQTRAEKLNQRIQAWYKKNDWKDNVPTIPIMFYLDGELTLYSEAEQAHDRGMQNHSAQFQASLKGAGGSR
ncbi:MAG: hypothetical protein DHS20C10_11520 [marine bacterium B5-7]|nr:MAG: hypothetical protein DHS20C10_11520 [marine bacterium B5-7]